jgi:phosphoglycolate phosphatase-like HAD superfamily hydrolase
MVPGSVEILEGMRTRDITCYLASGTDEVYVLDEAAALGLSGYFAGIYGALDDYQTYSKKMVIDRILAEKNLTGTELVTFGDGYVEIEDTKSVGGIAVGLATNEAERQGVDQWKRGRLIAAGADLIVPDFGQAQQLLTFLFPEA